ncbi:cubilin, partial [Asbolus verrucosus]
MELHVLIDKVLMNVFALMGGSVFTVRDVRQIAIRVPMQNYADMGWTTDGRSPACNTDVNECEMKKHPCSVNPFVQCVNLPGSFHCASCPPGTIELDTSQRYSGNGYYCKDIDECAQNNGGCSVNPMVQCVNTLGSRICGNCPAGYTGDGVSCSYEGACNVNNGGCHRLATCRNNPRISTTFVECVCPAGYIGSGVGPNGCIRSLQPIGPCAPNPCRHGICRPNGTDYTCDCYRRYTGRNCESFKNLCASNPCQNGGTCTSYLGMSYRCSCPSSYTGLRCEEEKQACGGRLQTESGVLIFPSGIFQNYGNSISCAWTIETNVSNVLNITFKRFNVESSRTCQYDWLQIHDGKNTLARSIGRFCGHNLPNGGVIISTHNIVYLWFRSDHSVSGEGFELNWTSIVPFLVHFHSDNAVNYPGFQITYSVVEAIPGCGGVYTRHQGEIRSPSYNGNYPNDVLCEYKIQLGTKSRIKLTFISFALEDSDGCQFDYVSIHAGSTSDDPLINKYCGTDLPSTYISENNVILIVFKTDWATSDAGFVLKYETVCGGKFTESTGILETPGYPDRYEHNMQCFYEIAQPLGTVIKLKFLDINLEKNSYSECIYDYIEVRDGSDENSTLIGTYCERPPPLIVSSYNYLWLKFESDSNTNGRGFQANYTTTKLEKSGTISSPNYPDVYPSGTICKWIISAPPGNIIQVVWMNFQLEPSHECTYDYVEIFENNTETGTGTSIGKYCGQNKPPTMLTTSNIITIVFCTDNTFSLEGFLATYTFMTESNVCGGNYYSSAGVLKSPNYPNEYPTNMECSWTIHVKPGHQILLNVTDFELESYSACRYDWLEIRNGASAVSPLLGRYCGTNIPKLIPSHANKLHINFKSDMTKSAKGFKIRWEETATGCGGTINSPTGSITSPGYPEPYNVNTECLWKISVSAGSIIQVVFSDLDLEEQSDCTMDYIELLDGPSLNSKSLGKYCSVNPSFVRSTSNTMTILYIKPHHEFEDAGPFEKYGTYCGDKIPPLISLNSDNAKIHFVTDNLLDGNGFRLEWQIEGCGDILTRPSGTITSPNYPRAYPASIECNWKIQVDYGSHVEITFPKMELEQTHICSLDYIKLFNGEDDTYPEIANICYQSKPITLRSSGNFMFVKFKADSSVQGLGFQANYTSLPTKCGGKYVADKARIMSPNYPNNYDKNDTCSYLIEVGEGHMIKLEFEDFDLYEPTEDCFSNNQSYVKVYDGPTVDYPVLVKICGKDAPNGTLTSTTNTMYVEMVTNTDMVAKGFLANYRKACGARIETEGTGIIKINTHDIGYDETNCSWTIVSKDLTKHVNLIVTHLDTLSTYCDEADKPFKVFNGESASAPLLGGYCGNKLPPTLTSDGAAMHVVVDYSSILFATYTVYDNVCGGTLTSMEGYFASPGYPKKYPMETECEWTIHVEEVHDNELSGTSGRIVSPLYSQPYPLYGDFSWKITVNYGKRILLTVKQLYLEEGDGMCFSEIDVYDGSDSNAPSLGEICGSVPPDAMKTTSNVVFIKFSGYSTTRSATRFILEWLQLDTNVQNTLPKTKGCGSKDPIDLNSWKNFTVITSPGYPNGYDHNLNCEWTITTIAMNHLDIYFSEMNLQRSYGSVCYADYVEVRNGGFPDSPILGDGKYCGVLAPFTLNTTSNSAYIKFFGFNEASDFTIRYGEISYECGGEIRLTRFANTTEISSPNYPNIPQPHTECFWRIIAPPGEVLRIDFIDRFDLKKTKECQKEYVEVRDGGTQHSKLIARFCSAPNSQFSSDNMLFVKFFTDIDDPSNGFKAKISLENCGGTIRDKRGQIQSPSFGKLQQYPTNANCIWHLLTPLDHNMKIKFKKIDLEEAENCTTVDHVKIYEMIEENGEINTFGYYCGKSIPDDVETSGNEAIVHFHTGKERKELGGFSLQFNSSFEECGGTIEASEGTIKSPGYPVPHKNFRRCRWFITVPRGRRVTLKIEDIDMDTRLRRSFMNGLSIYNYKHFTGYITTMSLSSTERVVRSTENTMFVFYWAGANAGRGFKAKFSSNEPSACEGDLNQNSGTINQPKASSYYCTYIRNKVSSESSTLALTIRTVTNVTTKN